MYFLKQNCGHQYLTMMSTQKLKLNNWLHYLWQGSMMKSEHFGIENPAEQFNLLPIKWSSFSWYSIQWRNTIERGYLHECNENKVPSCKSFDMLISYPALAVVDLGYTKEGCYNIACEKNYGYTHFQPIHTHFQPFQRKNLCSTHRFRSRLLLRHTKVSHKSSFLFLQPGRRIPLSLSWVFPITRCSQKGMGFHGNFGTSSRSATA